LLAIGGLEVGFWTWLTGKEKRFSISDDVVWLNQQAKCRGLGEEMRKRLDGSSLALLVGHFSATLDQMKAEIEARSLPYLLHRGPLTPARLVSYQDHEAKAGIILVLSEDLMADDFPNPVAGVQSELPILVIERHFLRPLDERILTFAATLHRRSRLTFHMSLEDPLIQAFVGQRMLDLLRNLGMQESRPVASPVIGRSVKSAQAQLARRVVGDRKAASAQEWFQLNVAGMTN
jgi:hypothetical protein